MSPEEAKQVIQALARGIDPETGEVLPPDNPLHGAHVIRALFLAAEALSGRPARSGSPPPQAGQPWSTEEEGRLTRAFDEGRPIAELAKAHARSRGAITSRLTRLGRLQLPAADGRVADGRAAAREAAGMPAADGQVADRRAPDGPPRGERTKAREGAVQNE